MLKLMNRKREFLIYIVLFLWIAMGVLGSFFDTDFMDLAAYFLSLTGFVSVYIWGESARTSSTSSCFVGGKNSTREILIYVTVFLWTALGVFAILNATSLIAVASYYATLTPFVGAYVLGETYKPEENTDSDQ